MSDAIAVIDDLRDESEELDALVAELSNEEWARATPAPGWTIAHQIAHLTWTDGVAVTAATDPGAFGAEVEAALAAPESFVDEAAGAAVAAASPAELLRRWRAGRERLQEVLREAVPGTRIPWYGPPMSLASMATARLMETWAHGQDVADALGVVRAPTGRLRHVARIGVRARDYAYFVRGATPPGEEFRVELEAPDGGLVAFGPESAAQRVTGPLLDFCLLVTRRAHRDDLALRAVGDGADGWLDIAQAFAGLPGAGRAPRGGKGTGGGKDAGGGRREGESGPSNASGSDAI
ncbi:TIGR03084 family metal-binding protein [Streptomyces sp. NPDC060184]|uniref:TIGR03084 family metal-binding protein n=1 Tax=Streptomyces sp. NPDC060184 TaxID=3347064 RepID=UPI0036639EA9